MSDDDQQPPGVIDFAVRMLPFMPQIQIGIEPGFAALVLSMGPKQGQPDTMMLGLTSVGPKTNEEGLEEIAQMLELIVDRLRSPDGQANALIASAANMIQREEGEQNEN